MIELRELIEKYGQPDALIDHWDKSSNRFAIWGFEEEFIINSEGYALINGAFQTEPPLQLWQHILNNWKSDANDLAAVGYIAYDLKNIIFPHIAFNKYGNSQPLLWFGKPKQAIPYRYQKKEKKSRIPLLELKKDIPPPLQYKRALDKIRNYLEKGDTYQINFTQPKKFNLISKPWDLYTIMRDSIQPHYGMYLDTGRKQILSFSPERFIHSHNGYIESFPMKGTRPRSNNLIIDERLARALLNSEKDKAEHLMIVDLIRNDIGKICDYGSLKVEDLFGIQSFTTVHHMVSKVSGKLKKEISETDIIYALFPGGSVTGAPKERSMQIIDSLEDYNRDIYTGAIGSIWSNGNMDFNIAIRTMSINNNLCTYPVGGGIVWDSDPIEEWKEAQQKSKILTPFEYDSYRKTPQFDFSLPIS